MEKIILWVEQLVTDCGITGDTVGFVTHTVLVMIAFLLAVLSGWICRKLFVPAILKLTAKT